MSSIKDEQMIEGLKFVCTCGACPEQYDVFDGEEMAGYVRLRLSVQEKDDPSHS